VLPPLLLLRWVVWLFAATLNLPAQATQAIAEVQHNLNDPASTEDLILKVKASGKILSNDLLAFSRNQQLYIPLTELAQLIGMPVQLSGPPLQLEGLASPVQQPFHLTADTTNRLEYSVQGEPVQRWPAIDWLSDMLELEGEVFVSVSVAEALWPIQLQYQASRLMLIVIPQRSLPELEQRERQRYRELKLRPQLRKDSLLANVEPYASFSLPLFEWRYVYKQSNKSSQLDLTARQDLFNLGHLWQVSLSEPSSSTKPAISIQRWRAHYIAAGKQLPPLAGGIRALELGDLNLPGSQAIEGGEQGRGLYLSTFPERDDIFEAQQIINSAPPGWEADLYINGQLIAHSQVDESGQYQFDLFLTPGVNRVDVRLYGPYGEKKIDRFTYNLGNDYLPRGQWGVSLAAIQPGHFTFRQQQSDQKSTEYRMVLGYGAGPAVNTKFYWYHTQQSLSNTSSQMTDTLGWSADGLYQGIYWRWLQLFEGNSHYADFQLRKAIPGWNWQAGLSYHPRWQGFRENRQNSAATANLLAEHHLRFKKINSTLGLKYQFQKQASANQHTATLYQRFRLRHWNLNTRQQCRFQTSYSCRLSHVLRYERNGTMLGMEHHGQFKADYSQHQFQLKSYLSLDRLLRADLFAEPRPLKKPGQSAPWLSQLQLSTSYTRTLTEQAQHSDWGESTALSLIWSHNFQGLKASASVQWNNSSGLSGSLSLSGQLLPAEQSYTARATALNHPARIRMFNDKNYDGQFSPTDSPLTRSRMRQRGGATPFTDDQGVIWTNLSSKTPLEEDFRTLDDPYLVGVNAATSYRAREERVLKIDWPLIETGAVEGTLSDARQRPLSSYKLLLISTETGSKAGEIITSSDGFFVFEFVRPGHYQVHLDLGESQQLLSEVEVLQEDPWPILELTLTE